MEESRLTEPEIDAALQLIQLSGDSYSIVVRFDDGGDAKRGARRDDCCGEESVGDTAEICSSSASASAAVFAVNIDVVIGTREDENLDWLSRKRKFRSVVELYRVTSPAIKATKRSKKANKK